MIVDYLQSNAQADAAVHFLDLLLSPIHTYVGWVYIVPDLIDSIRTVTNNFS